MKFKTLLIVLLFAYVNVVAAQSTSCDKVIREMIGWQIEHEQTRFSYHDIYFIMSTMHSYREFSRPWVSYHEGAFYDSSLTAHTSGLFSDRVRNMCDSDNRNPGGLCFLEQPFDYRQTTDLAIALVRPNILYLTYNWGGGETHKFLLTCKGEFMFGVSEQNSTLAVTFRTATWKYGRF